MVIAGPCECECALCEIGAHCRDPRHGCEVDNIQAIAQSLKNKDLALREELVAEVKQTFGNQ